MEHLSSQREQNHEKKISPLSEKCLKEVKIRILGNWKHSDVLMKYSCSQESPNTDFKAVVLFFSVLLITLTAE